MSELTLDDLFTFGKHKTEMVEDVIDDDPRYIEWLVENEVVQFDNETMELIARKGIA